MEDSSHQQEDARCAKDVQAPEVAKKWQPFFEDDIVPSLPPDWKPPTTFMNQEEMLSSADVSEIEHELNDDLDEEVSMM